MTDNEAICTAIVGGFTVLGAAIRWSAHVFKLVADRVVKAIDDSTAAWTKASETVQVLVREVSGLKQQLDTHRVIKTAVEEVVDEISDVHDAAQPDFDLAPSPAHRRTPPGGYPSQKRPGTQGGR